MQTEALKYGHFYHIYNRGTDSCDIFRNADNYEHFLGLYDKYISPIAETYAWVLMPNHFHLLVKVKEEEEIAFIPFEPHSGFSTTEGVDTNGDTSSEVFHPDGGYLRKKYKPANQFSHLFNAYAQAFNKRFERTGSLFQHPFKRKPITNDRYLKHVILYIHNNPVHHGFCSHPAEYPWSSYLSCVSVKPTKLKRETVLGWFDSEANFKNIHNEKVEIEKIERWLDI
jgi:putative transposase